MSRRYNEGSNAYPKGTCEESDHTTQEARLLALGSNTLVNALAEPNIRLHIPRIEEDLEVGWELDFHHLDISGTVPLRYAINDISETQTGEDAGAL